MARNNKAVLAVLAILLDEEEENAASDSTVNEKRLWVHKAWSTRDIEGEFATLYKELLDDTTKFYEYFRMTPYTFNTLFTKLEGALKKEDTRWRKAITARERLAVCIRYLATGDGMKTISFSYRLGQSTVRSIIHQTCTVIVETLLGETMPTPTADKWKSIAEDFDNLWNFPNCVGAIDGKHVVMQAPANSGSQYFNYKKTFSIVLLALVDANSNFIAVDVGSFGKNSDGGIFSHSNLGKRLERGTMNLPPDRFLPGTNIKAPFVVVGDEAFPLKKYLMRPYPGKQLDTIQKRIFNYRLCRARRLVENAFGILGQKFRIYNRRIHVTTDHLDMIVLSTCILHNFIRTIESDTANVDPSTSQDNTENARSNNLPPQGGNSTREAFRVRECFKDYFNCEGAISWQNDRI